VHVEEFDEKDRIAAAHGRFNDIRQVASVCTAIIHGSLGPSESSTQTASRSVQPFFCRAHSQTDRQTTLYSVGNSIGRIYVRSTAMWPKRYTKKPQHVTSHAFAKTTHVVAAPFACVVISLTLLVTYSKFHRNLFRGFCATGSKFGHSH